MKLPVTFGFLALMFASSCFALSPEMENLASELGRDLASIHAASSERIVPPMDPRSQECREKYWDHTFIAQALQAGKTKEWLIMAAESSLPPDHLAKVLPLIEEASKAENPTEWLNGYWVKCMQG